MNDPVGRLILEREAMDRGLGGSLMASAFAHLLVVAAAVAAPLLFPREPPLKVMDGFAVALPRGGGGVPAAEAPAPAPAPPVTAPMETAPPEPKPEAKILKPPKEEKKKGLPEPDAKKTKKGKPEKAPPRPQARELAGPGTSAKTPGLEFGPAGPGVPGGTDAAGDWYLASVQQKIWLIWTQQIKAGMTQPVTVTFTIQADGSVTDVETVQSSGASLLDLAAKRAIYSAAPFGPLPKDYGTNRITIQGIFKPTS